MPLWLQFSFPGVFQSTLICKGRNPLLQFETVYRSTSKQQLRAKACGAINHINHSNKWYSVPVNNYYCCCCCCHHLCRCYCHCYCQILAHKPRLLSSFYQPVHVLSLPCYSSFFNNPASFKGSRQIRGRKYGFKRKY